MKTFFTASIHQEGKWYVAHAIEFGVVSQGETLEKAKKNLQEAVELYFDGAEKRKGKISQSPMVTVLEAQM
jgi:predicted RNase H-like HicB family nuclease